MRNQAIVLKTDEHCSWVAVYDPASGRRGRYTVHRIYRWANKDTDVVGREVDLKTARKLAGKLKPEEVKALAAGTAHDCHWRKATGMLAKCVVATIQTDGKIGMGSGMVMKTVDGKRVVERWDKNFIEALAFIGLEVTNGKKSSRRRGAR